MEYQYVEFDASNILRDMNIILHAFLKEFISNTILSEDAGFTQKDNTFALYRARVEQFEDLVKKNFSQLPEEMYSKINSASMLILRHLLEQYIEKSGMPTGIAADLLKNNA